LIRNQLLELLQNYSAFNDEEKKMYNELSSFVKSYENCFERSLEIGHITGSCFIVNKERTHSLLMHHAKLDMWLQPGGHCDGDPDVASVSHKEAEEETGLKHLKIIAERIYDLDIHLIPARNGIVAHHHYDVRFLIEADMNESLISNEESMALEWVPLEDVRNYNESPSVLRMVEKLSHFAINFKV